MDKNRFDGFTRQLAHRENRRQALKTLFAGGLGTAAAVVASRESKAAKPGATDCCPQSAPILCGLTCTAIENDEQNCGSCGHQCAAGETCVAGACVGTITPCKRARDCPGTDTECQTRTCTNSVCGTSYSASGSPCPGGICDGSGACVECVVAGTCPGADTDCQTRTCIAGICGMSFATDGTPASNQTVGDCKANVCDGAGNVIIITDNTDSPASSECSTGICTNGQPGFQHAAPGTLCSGGLCDGNGGCVDCLVAGDCPGSDTECRSRTCDNGVCGTSNVSNGTPTPSQTPGDCQKNVCDGSGNFVSVADDTDTPASSECSTGICSNGRPGSENVAQGTACIGGICDGNGSCVECVSASTCPGTDTDCQFRTCNGGTCGMGFATSGTGCPTGFCDGSGACVECITAANCIEPPQAEAVCSDDHVCEYTCVLGFADCNGLSSDGCETFLSGDSNNCGACGNVCELPHTNLTLCGGGVCQVLACELGFQNCDGNHATGCETNVFDDSANCGTCGNVCGGSTRCRLGSCA